MIFKKGQLGKVISWFPVFLFLIVIIGIFIALTISLTIIRQSKSISFYGIEDKGNFLLSEIELDGKKIIIFDSLFKIRNEEKKEIDKKIYDEIVRKIGEASKNNRCIMLSSPYAYFFSKNGRFDPLKDYQFPIYSNKEKYNEILVIKEGKEFRIGYYDGECLK